MVEQRMRRSRSQEKRNAREFGGVVQPGSGSGKFRKGDVRTPTTLLECKRTDGKSYSLKLADLEKIRAEALAEGRIPLFLLEIGGREWVVCLKDDFPVLLPARPGGD